MDNEKCNTSSLEATAIPRCVKLHHIKEICNVVADSVSRLRAVSLNHDHNSNNHQQEFSLPFEPLPPVEQGTHIPIQVNEIIVSSDTTKYQQIMMHYMTY